MSYKCQVCTKSTPPNQPLLKMTIHRRKKDSDSALERTEIQGEIKLCGSCRQAIMDGVSLGDLLRRYRGDEMRRYKSPGGGDGG